MYLSTVSKHFQPRFHFNHRLNWWNASLIWFFPHSIDSFFELVDGRGFSNSNGITWVLAQKNIRTLESAFHHYFNFKNNLKYCKVVDNFPNLWHLFPINYFFELGEGTLPREKCRLLSQNRFLHRSTLSQSYFNLKTVQTSAKNPPNDVFVGKIHWEDPVLF